MKKKNIFLAIISMILLFQTPANAVTKFWIGGTSTDWSLGSNWSPAGVPLATDDVIIQDAAPASLQDCILTANVSCASLSAGINNANKFVIGNFTLTVTGNIVGGTSFGEYLLAMSPGAVIVASGNITDGGFLFDLTLGTGILRLEGATTSNISTLGDFNPITVNKTTGSTVTIDAGQLGSVPSVTMQNGTFAPSNLPVQQFFQQAFLKKLIVSGTNSTINVGGVGVMHVIDVEVLNGTCTIDNSDQLHVYDDWTQTGGTVLQSDPTKFISFRNMQAVILAPTQIVLALNDDPLNEINNAVISGTAINIQANVRIFKELASTTGAVPMPITTIVTTKQATTIGTTVANKNLLVSSGELILDMGVTVPITVNGNITIINNAILNAFSIQTAINLIGNFDTKASTLTIGLNPLGPFVKNPVLNVNQNTNSKVNFIGATNSTMNVSNLTEFDFLTISKVNANPTLNSLLKVTPLTTSDVIVVKEDFVILSGTFVGINLTDGVTNVNAVSAINNDLNRSTPKVRPVVTAATPLTIGGTTGEIIKVPNADIFVRKSVTIENQACLDLGTNEPQPNDLTSTNLTIAIHIGGGLTDNNNLLPSNGNAPLALTLDANNAGYINNTGEPKGLYVGLSNSKPMGQRFTCSGGISPFVPGLLPRSNYELPTIVFIGNTNSQISGNITDLFDYCNLPTLGRGMSLPNVIINKTLGAPATPHSALVTIESGKRLRINGNFTIAIGTFNMSGTSVFFGDYAGREGAVLADRLLEDDKIDVFGIFNMGVGATLLMNTSATERGTILRVRKGGYFNSPGTETAPNKVNREGTPGQYYRFCVYNGGGIASHRTEHIFMSARSDDFGSAADNALADLAVTKSPNYDLLATDSNLPNEVGDGSGHGWQGSKGGLKVLWGAKVNPFGDFTPDPFEPFDVDHSFGYCSFGSGGTDAIALTINTGQELVIYGAKFIPHSGARSGNVVANSRAYFPVGSTNQSVLNVILMKNSEGSQGGGAGEQFDGGKNDEDIAPLYDLVRWENFTFIYWVGDYDGAVTPQTPSLGVPNGISAGNFRRTNGEGPGSVLESDPGSPAVSELYSGVNTKWDNPKNWSLSNTSYYNPYQIYPGQPVPPIGFPKKRKIGDPIPPGYGQAGHNVPIDTLQKFEVLITRTATSNPVLDAATNNLIVEGSVIVNAGVLRQFKSGVLDEIRTANSFGDELVWRKRTRRADIVPQIVNAHQNVGLQKIFTIPAGVNFTVGGSFVVEVNGIANISGELRVGADIQALSNLKLNDKLPGNTNNMSSNDNADIAVTNLCDATPGCLASGSTSAPAVNNIDQLNFLGAGTLKMIGVGKQQIRVAGNPMHNIVVDKPSGETSVQGLNLSGRIKLNLTGDLTITGGKFNMLSLTPLLVNGNITLNPGVVPTEFVFESSAVTVRGNWINNGAIVNPGSADARINFHPNTVANRTIKSNNQDFPAVHVGFFDELVNNNDDFHKDALPERYPTGTPSNPSLPFTPASATPFAGAATYTIQDNFSSVGLTTIYANRTLTTLTGADIPIKLAGLKILSGGTLDLEPGAELLMDANPANPLFSQNAINASEAKIVQAVKTRTLLVQDGGTLDAVGLPNKFVKISRSGTSGTYRFIVEGTIRAQFFRFEFMDERGVDLSGLTPSIDVIPADEDVIGANGSEFKTFFVQNTPSPFIVIPIGVGIGATAAIRRGQSTNIGTIGSFSDGLFTNGSTLANATYLRLPTTYTTLPIERTQFPTPLTGAGSSNVSRIEATSNTVITVFNFATGAYAGEPFDNETNGASPGFFGHIEWVEDLIKRWDGRVDAGGLATTNNDWNNPFNWEGDAVPLPTQNVVLDYLAPNLDPAYTAALTPRKYIVNANKVGANNTDCKSLKIITRTPRVSPTTNYNIDLRVVTGISVLGAPVTFAGGDFAASKDAIINANGLPIKVAGSWSNGGTFISGLGTVTFGPSEGLRVINAGDNGPINNSFHNLVFEKGTTEMNSSLFIRNNLTIEVGCLLDANAGSNLLVDNRIEIEGNWLNRGLFNPRVGLVVFTGNQNQTITKTNTPTFETFFNLRIAKGDIISASPAPSVTDVTLNSRVLVGDNFTNDANGALFLVNGRFFTNTALNTQMILAESASWSRASGVPTAPNGSAYVEGPFGRIFVNPSSLEDKSFPIGKTQAGVPLYLGGSSSGSGEIKLGIQLDRSVKTTFTMEQFATGAESFSADPNRTFQAPLNVISNNRWWDVKNIEFPNTTANAADIQEARIELPFTAATESFGAFASLTPAQIEKVSIVQDFDVAFDKPLNNFRGVVNALNTQRVKRGFSPEKGDIWRDLGSSISDLTSNTAAIQSLVPFRTLGNGQFTFGFQFLPLPVELLDLKAEVAGEKVRVSWITVSEKNNDYFIVEKSIDARSFEEVGRVPAKTSTNALNNYEIFDANPYQAINYYRLKQFDKDGKFTYSKIISIKMGKTTANNLSIYPNPTTNNEFVVDLKGTDLAGAQVTITDMLGKTVYSTKIDQNGTNQLIRPNTTLAAGMYVVTVQTNDKVYQQRLSVR